MSSEKKERLLRPKPKVEKACAQIAEMAQRLGAHVKLPTVNELCERLEVSRSTLDMALHELEARSVIYRLHGVGVYVSPQVKKTICILYDSRNALYDRSPFWTLMIEAHQKQSRFFGFDTVTEDVAQTAFSASLRESLRHGSVHGLLALSLDQDADFLLQSSFGHVPCVSVAGPGRWCVGLDMHICFESGVEALIRRGCKRVGLWAHALIPHRMTHWMQLATIASHLAPILTREGLDFHADLMRVPSATPQLGIAEEQGFQLAHEVFGAPANAKRRPSSTRSTSNDGLDAIGLSNLKAHEADSDATFNAFSNGSRNDSIPDGLFIANDMMARGALRALDELGVVVGRDVHLAAQTNAGSPVLRGEEHRLIRVEYDLNDIACTSLEILENLIRGRGSIHLALVQPRLLLPQTRRGGDLGCLE